MNELPTITSSAYANAAQAVYVGDTVGGTFTAVQTPIPLPTHVWDGRGNRQPVELFKQENDDEDEDMSNKRLVRVLVVDAHEDVPVEMGLLHDSKELFTDKTDQELFFDIPIAAMLAAHNDKRTKIVDSKVKDRTEYLKAARIRDLNMVVLAIAKF